MEHHWILWVGFNCFVLAMLALDLGVFHRRAHAVSLREAAIWSVVWVVLALAFNGLVYWAWGYERALEFLTGYLIEKSLSVDNLFVFLMIFSYFAVPAIYQHRVLYWGILGALVMRGIFIATGVALMNRFHWMIYVFGGFLVVTGIRLLFSGDKEVEPARNPVVKLVRRVIPVTEDYRGQSFFVRDQRRLWATPLLLVLIVVETTDLVFALDSIPAIFAVTKDPFIVYTSNVFAILGLRALYFLLAGVMDMFRFLQIGLAVVLTFVGTKMLVSEFYKIPIGWSLAVVAGVLSVAVLASLLFPKREGGAEVERVAGTKPGGERVGAPEATPSAKTGSLT
ncbi:MAG: TerC family protein [Candidatus Binatia bacterium]|nr:TerC family protein [Candidatus Binatia bacterium]